jgi:hypothetical protein
MHSLQLVTDEIHYHYKLKRQLDKLTKDQQAVADERLQVTSLRDSVEKKEGREVKRLGKEKLELQRTKGVLALSNNSLAGKVQEGVERAARLHEEQ